MCELIALKKPFEFGTGLFICSVEDEETVHETCLETISVFADLFGDSEMTDSSFSIMPYV